MTIKRWLSLTMVAVATVAGLTMAVPANAAPAGPTFAAQARAAGLSTGQSAVLQAKVDRILTITGGRQVSPNRIDLDGRGSVSVALPGERYPRTFGAAASLSSSCAYGHFCAYNAANFTGSVIDMWACGPYNMPWSGYGSWDNNQTTGTYARMYGAVGNLLFTTAAAHSYDPSNAYWTPIYTIINC